MDVRYTAALLKYPRRLRCKEGYVRTQSGSIHVCTQVTVRSVFYYYYFKNQVLIASRRPTGRCLDAVCA
jgi:hypothetical protein